ncbi:GNAT family N-acetyltransferase [Methylobacterium sp. 092160098-2]|uniref:GNAT family N-acetyltransferase n=1 Tax=Methylobacterium sp. 092160098-2 TaxID=3025129 RepID=UPI002381ABE6|nr:GNAT family N-acetyltransferase [Methylobacterium sp. 092160098-2]MDE4914205.1 GNAT family N-acetyltransferase [Methylobacterium sp. 092160098-2]
MDARYAIRRLVPSDAGAHRGLRLEAIATTPLTFAEELDRAAARSVADHEAALAQDGETATFGAFLGGDLVGMASLTPKRPPCAHIAKLSSVFVVRGHRQAGVAAGLVARAETAARALGATRITLAVATHNDPARRLYERLGYAVYGIEPSAMRLDGVFVDEELRSKFLTGPAVSVADAFLAA